MKRIALGLMALLLAASLAAAANLTLLSGPQDPSQLQFTINQLIQAVNAGTGSNSGTQTGAVATGTGTGEQTLQTFTVPANTLANVGDQLNIRCFGVTGANGNNKTMKLYFGTSVITTPTAATNNKGWELALTVMRTGSATETVVGTGTVDVTPVTVFNSLGTDDLTTALVAKCTGTDGTSSAGDITANAMLVSTRK